MKPYIVNLSLKPAINLGRKIDRLELKFEEPADSKIVHITNIEEKDSVGTTIFTGLNFRVFLDSEDIDEAIISAKWM